MTTNKSKPDWEEEYERLVREMTKYFNENRIQEFLITHLRISQLFTNKLQHIIDNTEHITYEYKLDANPELMKKLDEFNTNLSYVLGTNKSLHIPEKNENKVQGEVKGNPQGSGGEPKA